MKEKPYPPKSRQLTEAQERWRKEMNKAEAEVNKLWGEESGLWQADDPKDDSPCVEVHLIIGRGRTASEALSKAKASRYGQATRTVAS